MTDVREAVARQGGEVTDQSEIASIADESTGCPDEIEFLQSAYCSLTKMDRAGQVRSLHYLECRLADEYEVTSAKR